MFRRVVKAAGRGQARAFSVQNNNKGPRITSIHVYKVEVPLAHGPYHCGRSKSFTSLDTTLVNIKTDVGIDGWGEHCPFGSNYLPAYANGLREGIKEIGPALIGENPTHLLNIHKTMDHSLDGHKYVKTPIDIACWDILGKMAGLPLYMLFGGKFGESVPLYWALTPRPPEDMAEETKMFQEKGYTKFQVKLGYDIQENVERVKAVAAVLRKGDVMWADANCIMNTREAQWFLNGIRDVTVPLTMEQLCQTYEENLFIRQKCPFPMMLDENIDGTDALLRMSRDKAADVISVKIGKVGGLTHALNVRNLSLSLQIPMTIEDTWGWDVIQAAYAHLAHSTPPHVVNATLDLHEYAGKSLVDNPAVGKDGYLAAPEAPGLGVTPLPEVIGEPFAVIE